MRVVRALGVAAALSLTAVAVLPSPSPAGHAWGTYHWARTSNPFTIKLGDNVSSAWDSYLSTASSDWTQSSVLDTAIVNGAGSKCRAKTGQVEVCASKYGKNGWLGIAQIWISGSHITAGTVKMNDTYFTMAGYNTSPWRRLVMCQEIGHTFGLGHTNETFGNVNDGTCMDYTNDPDGGDVYGPSNEHPNAHDYEMLESIYSHLDSTTTVGATTTSNRQGDLDLDTPDSWGKKTHSHNGGKHEQFERDLGNGNKVITEVIWVDDDVLAKGKAKGKGAADTTLP